MSGDIVAAAKALVAGAEFDGDISVVDTADLRALRGLVHGDDQSSKLYHLNAAKNPDNVLEQAVGWYQNLVIIGWDHEGELEVRSDTGLNKAQVNLLIDEFKARLLAGEWNLE